MIKSTQALFKKKREEKRREYERLDENKKRKGKEQEKAN